MSDKYDDIAKSTAFGMPISDFGSGRALRAFADALRSVAAEEKAEIKRMRLERDEARGESSFWRDDAAARLWQATCLVNAYRAAGNRHRESDLIISVIGQDTGRPATR